MFPPMFARLANLELTKFPYLCVQVYFKALSMITCPIQNHQYRCSSVVINHADLTCCHYRKLHRLIVFCGILQDGAVCALRALCQQYYVKGDGTAIDGIQGKNESYFLYFFTTAMIRMGMYFSQSIFCRQDYSILRRAVEKFVGVLKVGMLCRHKSLTLLLLNSLLLTLPSDIV